MRAACRPARLFRRSFPTLHTRNLSLPRTLSEILTESSIDSEVTVHGWIQSVRKQKKVAFALVTDGTTLEGLQAVLRPEDAVALTNGASVALTGWLVRSTGSQQAIELQVHNATVLGDCNAKLYPIQKKELSTEYLRENLHLRGRTNRHAALLRVRDALSRSIHKWFAANHFCHINTPILTSSDCEGAGEVFRVQSDSILGSAAMMPVQSSGLAPTEEPEFFRRRTFLTVSAQLHLEAVSSSLSRVYALSPTFRAEPSQTHRHLAEFWMLEAEMSFTRDLSDVMDVVEASIKAVLTDMLPPQELESDSSGITSLSYDMGFLRSKAHLTIAPALVEPSKALHDLFGVYQKPWPRMTYTDALDALATHQASSRAFSFPTEWGDPLQSEHEKWLAGEFVGGPVFITDYPSALKPFYMRRNEPSPDGRETVACFDLLVPSVGELAGGSLREERVDLLEHAMSAHSLSAEDYRWYADLRRYGGVPHGGYGMGWERFISWLTHIDNVRDCIPFPRWAGNIML